MGVTEYVLLVVVVIAIPLAIAGAVTLWSLKQVQYRPKQGRQRAAGSEPASPERPAPGDRSGASSS